MPREIYWVRIVDCSSRFNSSSRSIVHTFIKITVGDCCLSFTYLLIHLHITYSTTRVLCTVYTLHVDTRLV